MKEIENDVAVKHRDLIRYAETKGWKYLRQGRGSHIIYSHPAYWYVISISSHGSKDVPKGTLTTLIKQIDGTWRP